MWPTSAKSVRLWILVSLEKYEKNKNQKKNKHQSPASITKEIQLGYNTQKHDLDVKHKHVIQFLEKGHKVKYTMRLKNSPREDTLIVQRFEQRISEFKEIFIWEKSSKANGQMSNNTYTYKLKKV